MFRTMLIALAVTAAAFSLTGCSDDGSSPTGPTNAEPTMDLRTVITVTKVDVIHDGDGIEGGGEFYFYRQVGGTGIGWTRNLSSGQSTTVNWNKTLLQRDYEGEGHPFSVMFRCTEYDQNIWGDVYPDSDMNDRGATANYISHPGLSETNYITLGNDQCKVRMHYRITSQLVESEEG